MIVIVIVGVLSMFAIRAFQGIISTAYKVTIRHDLQKFVEMEEIYFTWHRHYFGTAGDYIQGGAHPSGTLVIPDGQFVPSEGVRIEITSGNGQAMDCIMSAHPSSKPESVITIRESPMNMILPPGKI